MIQKLQESNAEMRQLIAKYILLEKKTLKKEDICKLTLTDSQCKELIEEYHKQAK